MVPRPDKPVPHYTYVTFIKSVILDAIRDPLRLTSGAFYDFLRVPRFWGPPGNRRRSRLGYWNDWYRSSMFSTNSDTWELSYLYNLMNAQTAIKQMAQHTGLSTADLPTESVKMAMAVVATGPVLLFYPFVQKYFVTGITIGAVKG